MLQIIDGNEFMVNDDDFICVKISNFKTLKIINTKHVNRLISFVKLLSSFMKDISISTNSSYYTSIKLSKYFNTIYTNIDINTSYNINTYKIDNIIDIKKSGKTDIDIVIIDDINNYVHNHYTKIIITLSNNIVLNTNDYIKYSFDVYNVYVKKDVNDSFNEVMKYDIHKDVMTYDNLLHLVMIVKDAGKDFQSVLEHNKQYIDRWTILDTGSTDNTVNTIKDVLSDKRGELHEEPFISFKDSRNRSLDLAGEDCEFVIILDDTYVIDGDLRTFLDTIRGDQFANSFSMYITSNDSIYSSNRILRPRNSHIRYIGDIHEVLNPNNNIDVIIPKEISSIIDRTSDYMERRTSSRKLSDIQILHNMEENEHGMNSRTIYYLATSYYFIKNYQKAFEYYIKRIYMTDGFSPERSESAFEAARIANFHLSKPWIEVLSLYEISFLLDNTLPYSLYFIGIHYYLVKDYVSSFEYLKHSFATGYPVNSQFNLKPTIYYYYLPIFLSELCVIFKDNILLEKVCNMFINNVIDNHVFGTVYKKEDVNRMTKLLYHRF